MRLPAISIIIPTYDHAAFIRETIESVFAQTFTDYEVIVVNDGSPDNTSGVLQPYLDSGKIQYIEQANAGQAAARNRGLSVARGDFIAFLDDDDLWPVDKLDWQMEVMHQSENTVLVYGYGQTFGLGESNRVPAAKGPSGRVYDSLIRQNVMYSPGQARIRSSALRMIGGFDKKIWGADDWDIYLSLSSLGDFVFCDRLALKYRIHLNNASRRAPQMYLNACRVHRKHTKLIDGWIGDHIYHGFYGLYVIQSARDAMVAENWKEAAALWRMILWCKPTRIFRMDVLQGFVYCSAKAIGRKYSRRH